MLLAFFARVKPASTIAKPACMRKTRKAAISTQTVLSALASIPGATSGATCEPHHGPTTARLRKKEGFIRCLFSP